MILTPKTLAKGVTCIEPFLHPCEHIDIFHKNPHFCRRNLIYIYNILGFCPSMLNDQSVSCPIHILGNPNEPQYLQYDQPFRNFESASPQQAMFLIRRLAPIHNVRQ